MKLTPVLTEKTLAMAKNGKFTFWVDPRTPKGKVRELVSKVYGVTVTGVWTVKIAGEAKRTAKGRKRAILDKKKAIVTLKDKETIKAFDAKK